MPSAGGKGNALKYVMDRLGVEPEKALCCGDSGNDSPMFDFENVGVRGVVVANAFDDLRGYCEEQVCPEKRQPVHYFASERMAVSFYSTSLCPHTHSLSLSVCVCEREREMLRLF